MSNTNKDDAKGYDVKKERVERLTGLFHGVLRLVVEEVDESPVLPSRIVVNLRQQAIVDDFVKACESTSTPPRQKPKALQSFLGGGPHWTTPVKGPRKRNKPEIFCPPAAASPVATSAAVAGAVDIDDYEDTEGEVIIQHKDVGEQLAQYDGEGNLQFGSIESVTAWGSILIRNLKFDDKDCGTDELTPQDLKIYKGIYQTVKEQDPIHGQKQKAPPKTPVKQKTKPKAKQKKQQKKQQKKSPKKKTNKKDKKGPPPSPPEVIEENELEYSPKTPKLFEVKYRDDEEDYEYHPIPIEEEYEFFPKFEMPPGANLVPNIETMCELAYPDHFLKEVCKRSNAYAIAQTKLDPRIPVDKDKPDGQTKPNPNYLRADKVKPIDPYEMLLFFATIHYMGYCKLPSKHNY